MNDVTAAEADPAEAASLSERGKAYIAKRVEPQRQWHHKAASRAKTIHHRLAVVQIAAMAMVPVVNTAPPATAPVSATFITSLLAAVAAIATGVLGLGKYQETWLRSRKTAEALDSVVARYEVGAAPFTGEDRETILVMECESLLSGEIEQWVGSMKSATLPKLDKLAEMVAAPPKKKA
jgi:hypothetical protein